MGCQWLPCPGHGVVHGIVSFSWLSYWNKIPLHWYCIPIAYILQHCDFFYQKKLINWYLKYILWNWYLVIATGVNLWYFITLCNILLSASKVSLIFLTSSHHFLYPIGCNLHKYLAIDWTLFSHSPISSWWISKYCTTLIIWWYGHGKLGAYAQANKHDINRYLRKNDSCPKFGNYSLMPL